MPYYIIPYLNGFRVISESGHYLSNRPLPYEKAKKQLIAVSLNEQLIGSGSQWGIHSVVFHKPYDEYIAMLEAKKIIKHNNYNLRETKSSYRYSVPKELFQKFRTHKVNPNISIIFGEFK